MTAARWGSWADKGEGDMNVLQKAAHVVLLHGGSLLGSAFRSDYLAVARRGAQHSEKMLLKLLHASRNTEYGKKYGFADIKTVADYQDRVPLSEYGDYRDYIRRTAKDGTQHLMTGHRVNYFAATSGTVGEPKLIPQTAEAYLPYFKCICIFLRSLVKSCRARGVSSAVARGLLVTEVSMQPSEQMVDWGGKTRAGGISSYAAGGLKSVLPLFTAVPGELFGITEHADTKYVKALFCLREPDLKWMGGIFMSAVADQIAYIEAHHELLIHDIEAGTIDPSVAMSAGLRTRLERKLRPDPRRAAELREIFSTPSDVPLCNRIWKDMSFVCAIGTADFMPFTQKVKAECSSDVGFHLGMYAASEDSVGCALDTEQTAFLLLPDSGFFEFLPIPEECQALPERPLLMQELEVGKHYEIIITNLSGLYRYRLGDVVKVAGFAGQIPYIEFAYRAEYITNLCNIHLTGEELSAAVEQTAAALGAAFGDYCLFPDVAHVPPRLELFFETDRPLSPAELERAEALFDKALDKCSEGYKLWGTERRVIGTSVLRPVTPGTHMRYREERIAAGAPFNQLKAVRIIDTPGRLAFFRAAEIRS